MTMNNCIQFSTFNGSLNKWLELIHWEFFFPHHPSAMGQHITFSTMAGACTLCWASQSRLRPQCVASFACLFCSGCCLCLFVLITTQMMIKLSELSFIPAGTDDFCLAMDGSERSYQLLGTFAAGQHLYRLERDPDDILYIIFCPEAPYSSQKPATRVKIPTLHATEEHLNAWSYNWRMCITCLCCCSAAILDRFRKNLNDLFVSSSPIYPSQLSRKEAAITLLCYKIQGRPGQLVEDPICSSSSMDNASLVSFSCDRWLLSTNHYNYKIKDHNMTNIWFVENAILSTLLLQFTSYFCFLSTTRINLC